MAKNTSRSKTAENNSATYKATRKWETNRKRKLEALLKVQPTNEQIKQALKGMVYRRKTPKTSEWSASWKKTAQLFKMFTGKFDRNIMSSNPKVASEAMQLSRKNRDAINLPSLPDKHFFSLGTRIYKGPK